MAWEQRQAAIAQPRYQLGENYQSAEIRTDAPTRPSERDYKGPMAHGVGFEAPTGLIKIAGMETTPQVAEGLRLSMSPAEWKANTGLEYVSVLNGPAPQQAQQTELQKMQAEHQARVDERVDDPEADRGP